MGPRTDPARVMLLAGASGSGKSRVARLAGRPQLALDDFYFNADHPGLPRLPSTGSGREAIVDWDDPASWDGSAALEVLVRLAHEGRAEVPVYDISASRRTSTQTVELGGADCVVAEGIFAPELVGPARAAGLKVEALYLDRPRSLTAVLRLARDLRDHRKPAGVLLRRGLALWRAEPRIRAHALAAGCRPVSLRKALALISAPARLRR